MKAVLILSRFKCIYACMHTERKNDPLQYAVVLENGLLYELVGRLGVKKQKKKWKTCSK